MRAKSKYPENCVIAPDLQEVIDRINQIYFSVEIRRAKDDRAREQEHRPGFHIPRITRALARFIFSADRRRSVVSELAKPLGQTETTALYRTGIYQGEHSNSGGRGWFDGRSDLTESGRSI